MLRVGWVESSRPTLHGTFPGLEPVAGCLASRATSRRPSALLSARPGECCFRLAGRLSAVGDRLSAGPVRAPPRPKGLGPIADSRQPTPRALPPPGHAVDATDRRAAAP